MQYPVDGLLELLRGNSPFTTKNFALESIIRMIDVCWFEMTNKATIVQQIYETENYPKDTRTLAAVVLAKLYFHLSEYERSVYYALRAVPAFNFGAKDQFTVTIVGKIIDQYISRRQIQNVRGCPYLEKFFDTLFDSWSISCLSKSPKELMGLAIQARRLDLLAKVIESCANLSQNGDYLSSCLEFAKNFVPDINFRVEVIELLVQIYEKNVCSDNCFPLLRCLTYLRDHSKTASLMVQLLQSEYQIDKLIAFQISFEIFESRPASFISNTLLSLESVVQSLRVVHLPILDKVRKILHGEITTGLYAKFLYSKNTAQVSALTRTKKAIEGKSLISHNALVIANSYLHCGTTVDEFLRTNISWLGKASHWGKFTAVASLGGIYKGSVGSCMQVLDSYLPNPQRSCPFQGGGALFALGILSAPLGSHANVTIDQTETLVKDYLTKTIESAEGQPEVIHGGALGLGLVMMDSHNEDVCNLLHSNLLLSDAVTGESCAVSLGLVMMGSGKEDLVSSLLSIAREKDQKEKIIRGISMSIALIMYGKEANALTCVDKLLADKDPWIRMGGCMTIAMAFAGTPNMKAIECLLRSGIQDVSDDVKRTAILCIGFLTFTQPQVALDVLREFSDSHNTNIRYGVAIALGIAGSGSGHNGIVNVLWKLFKDTNDFVRQGSAIALSMVLIQKTVKENSIAREFREALVQKIDDRHVDICTKFGCILAQGIIDAGGQNSSIVLHKDGRNFCSHVASLFLFSQYWFWFPYALMLTQCFSVSCFIGLNSELEMPKCTLHSRAPMAFFEPVLPAQCNKPETRKSSTPVELSTTKREIELQKVRDAQKLLPEVHEKGQSPEETTVSTVHPVEKAAGGDLTGEELANPCRLTESQVEFVEMNPREKFQSVKKSLSGICMIYNDGDEPADGLVEMRGNPLHENDFAPPEDFILS